jgi:hypothetical protein
MFVFKLQKSNVWRAETICECDTLRGFSFLCFHFLGKSSKSFVQDVESVSLLPDGQLPVWCQLPLCPRRPKRLVRSSKYAVACYVTFLAHARTNSWFLTRNYQNKEVCNSRIHLNQNSNFKFLLYCKPKWHNKVNRDGLVLVNVLHTIQWNWYYWLTVTVMRLIPIRFSKWLSPPYVLSIALSKLWQFLFYPYSYLRCSCFKVLPLAFSSSTNS